MSGVDEVLSLTNVRYACSVNGAVEANRLISSDLPQALAKARAVATSDRLYLGNLVSSDARTAALNILFKPEVPTHIRHGLTKKIYDLVRQAGYRQSFFTGDPFAQWRSTEAIKSDLKVFLPLTIILIALLLWLSFRSLVAVLLPLLTIGIGLVWLLGLMAWLNAHFTILSLMLPTIMLAIGCSYMIHVVNQIAITDSVNRHSVTPMRKTEVLAEAMRFINLPVIVSALTIIAGFLSLAFAKIPAIRSSAIYAAVGAAVTMALSLTFIPAMLSVCPHRIMEFRVGLGGKMVKLLERTGNFAVSHQIYLYALTALIIIASLIGMWRIKIDIDYFRFSKAKSETSIGVDQIGKRLSGAVTFDLIVEGRHAGAIENSNTLKRIAELQAFAEGLPKTNGQGIDRTLSVVDFVKHLNRAFHDNDPQYYSIPAEEDSVQELLSDRQYLQEYLSSDGRKARIMIRSNLTSSQLMAGMIQEVEAQGRQLLPEFQVFATGTFVLLNRTSDQLGGEQIKSVSIALVTIYLMLSLLFGSVSVGMTALIPNLIPVLFFFGFMGWSGINLNLTTCLVASVVLGLAVDNSVQLIVRFRRVQPESPNIRDAIIQSMRLSGRPIIYANIALAAAFAIFALSNFKPVASFGLLAAVTIIGCLIEDLVLLPARLTSPIFQVVDQKQIAHQPAIHRDVRYTSDSGGEGH